MAPASFNFFGGNGRVGGGPLKKKKKQVQWSWKEGKLVELTGREQLKRTETDCVDGVFSLHICCISVYFHR